MTMNRRALVATRKGLFELARGHADNGDWTVERSSFVGEPVSMTLFDRRDGSLYAALNLGHFGVKLHRRREGGEWQEIAVPAYPPQPEDSKDDVPWKLALIWSLAAGGADEPGVLWAGTLPGGLFRSGDHGDSWQLVNSLWEVPGRREWFGGGYDVPGMHSICVDPRDSRHLVVGISCGGAWATRDGGASWTSRAAGMRADYMPPERADDQGIQDPHRIVRCAAAPDVLWCQHHNGIWRSIDDGASWQQIGRDDPTPGSTFGFAVAVHPQQAETAWFVPAAADQKRIPVDGALCVTRTRDGGRSFEVLRKGLPQQHCYDLIYRHGLAVSDDGNCLMMGSTTGGLWVSENGGDDWREIFSRLPPVYALQFC
jgi:hypothetical protein